MKKTIFVLLFALMGLRFTGLAQEAFIGEIRMFSGTFEPKGWAFCRGQMLSIAQNTALFSILGTTYGGDGRTTFALPDMRGRVPVQAGESPGLSNYELGEKGGAESLTIHFPTAPSQAEMGKSIEEVAKPEDRTQKTKLNPTDGRQGGGAKILGGSSQESAQTVDNRQPFLGLNFIICLQGIYPSRN